MNPLYFGRLYTCCVTEKKCTCKQKISDANFKKLTAKIQQNCLQLMLGTLAKKCKI